MANHRNFRDSVDVQVHVHPDLILNGDLCFKIDSIF